MTYAHSTLSAPVSHTTATPVSTAIARASARTGVDFSYLMNKAQIESSLNPTAKARTSSATGLYQFTQKTWLEMVREYGDKYGLSHYAAVIDDKCRVTDGTLRQEILALRNDPETSACMAAEYAAQNASILEQKLGPSYEIGDTELYLAHFLGPGGASKFLSAMEKNPKAAAASFFSTESRVNKGVFFDRVTGAPRSFQDIYDQFSARMTEPKQVNPAFAHAQTDRSSPSLFSYSAQETFDMPASFLNPSRSFVDALLAAPQKPTSSRPIATTRASEFSFPSSRIVTPEQTLSQAALLVMIQDQRDQSGYNT